MKNYIIILIIIGFGALAVWFLINEKVATNENLSEENIDLSVINNEEVNTIKDNNNITTQPITNNDIQKMTTATINTNMGDITIEFFEKDAPKTVENFLKLAKEGYYDGIKFHRVIPGFMIQAGDPLTKDDSKMSLWGTGGPGYKFADEIDAKSDLYTKTGYKKGIMAMANSGPNTNGSQFFIMHTDYPLPPSYAIFAKVVSGLDVVDKIGNTKTTTNDRPVSPIIIKSVSVK